MVKMKILISNLIIANILSSPTVALQISNEEPCFCIAATAVENVTQELGVDYPAYNDFIVYKPSTNYVHKSSCHWVDDSCYEITDTTGIYAIKCTECNPAIEIENEYVGEKLNVYNGTVYGPSGKETYYNLDMSGVISIMRNLGYDEINYPYWVRDDGLKMLGPYGMCAANLNVHERGSLVETSLGTCIVCDTGGFAAYNPYQLDLAVTWY